MDDLQGLIEQLRSGRGVPENQNSETIYDSLETQQDGHIQHILQLKSQIEQVMKGVSKTS